MSPAESQAIDRAFAAALKQIRAWNLAHRDPDLSRSYAIDPGLGEYPSVKECKRINGNEHCWRSQGGSVLQAGTVSQKCVTCGTKRRAKNRTRCYGCIHAVRVAKGWNIARANKRKALREQGDSR